jgi:hypothetical protein
MSSAIHGYSGRGISAVPMTPWRASGHQALLVPRSKLMALMHFSGAPRFEARRSGRSSVCDHAAPGIRGRGSTANALRPPSPQCCHGRPAMLYYNNTLPITEEPEQIPCPPSFLATTIIPAGAIPRRRSHPPFCACQWCRDSRSAAH